MQESNKTIKASFWYMISSFFMKGLGFITIPIFSRLMSKVEFGYYNNFTAWLSLLTIVVTLSLTASLARGRFDYEDDLYSFITSNLLMGSASTVVFAILFWCAKDFASSVLALDWIYIVIMFVSMVFLPSYNMFQQVQRFKYKYKLVVALTVGSGLGSVVLSLILMYTMEDRLMARVLGAQLPSIILSVFLYAYFLIKGRNVKKEHMRYSLAICLPYMIHLLAGSLLNSSDRVMITNTCGAESTALYGMAYNIAMIVSVLWESLNSAFSPWLGEKLHAKDYEGIKKYTYGYVLVFLCCLIGVVLIAPEVLFILGGKDYVEAKYVIPPVMYGYLLLFVYSMYVNIEQFEKKTSGMAVATAIAAAINIGLNLILLPRFGYIAAAYTTVIGYLFLYVFHYLLVKKMGFAHVYNTKFIFLTVLGGAVILGGALLLYNSNIIRYLLIVAYGVAALVLAVKNRELIFKLIK